MRRMCLLMVIVMCVFAFSISSCFAVVDGVSIGEFGTADTIDVDSSGQEIIPYYVSATYDQYLDREGILFTFNKSFKLTKKGFYYMKATLYCYKKGVLKEKITKKHRLNGMDR